MRIIYSNHLNIQTCRDYPNHLFVFGGNLAGYGTAGQAVIRFEPNAFEIPTKRFPSMAAGAFFTDQECEREHVLSSLRELYTLRKQQIVFPKNGVGTGMAKMPEMSPLLFKEMNDILLKHFGIVNGGK